MRYFKYSVAIAIRASGPGDRGSISSSVELILYSQRFCQGYRSSVLRYISGILIKQETIPFNGQKALTFLGTYLVRLPTSGLPDRRPELRSSAERAPNWQKNFSHPSLGGRSETYDAPTEIAADDCDAFEQSSVSSQQNPLVVYRDSDDEFLVGVIAAVGGEARCAWFPKATTSSPLPT